MFILKSIETIKKQIERAKAIHPKVHVKAKVKYNNIHVMKARIRKAFEPINSMVGIQQCQIVPAGADGSREGIGRRFRTFPLRHARKHLFGGCARTRE